MDTLYPLFHQAKTMPRNPHQIPVENPPPQKPGQDRTGKAERRSRGRPKIPTERIIDAAMEIIDTQGVEALSMRAIAQHLDSGTATLYRNFSGRTELIGLVIDKILSEISVDSDSAAKGDWQTAVSNSAKSMLDVLIQHKGIAALLVETMPDGPNSMEQRERLIGLFLAGGFSAEIAARAFIAIIRFVLGFAMQVDDARETDRKPGQLHSTYQRGLDPYKFPALHAAAAYLPIGINEEFAFGLQMILSGLAQQKDAKSWPHEQL